VLAAAAAAGLHVGSPTSATKPPNP
jgi:hypothetical protein